MPLRRTRSFCRSESSGLSAAMLTEIDLHPSLLPEVLLLLSDIDGHPPSLFSLDFSSI